MTTAEREAADSIASNLLREFLVNATDDEALTEFKFWTSHQYEPVAREALTETALSLSLCPLHLIDYAICFDDQTPECEAIRQVHPTHDT